MFNYSGAIVRSVPKCFNHSLRNNIYSINANRAVQQHNNYTKTLKYLLFSGVNNIPSDNNCPDSPFVESSLLFLDGTFILNKMLLEPSTRRKELSGISKLFSSSSYLRHFYDHFTLKRNCFFNPSDILITQKDVLVGLSGKTNLLGFHALKSLFPNRNFIPIEINNEKLLLKSIATVLDEETLVVSRSKEGNELVEQLTHTNYIGPGYDIIRVPNRKAANVVRIKDTVLIPSGYPESFQILHKAISKRNLNSVQLNISEFIKADGDMSCLSVLYK